MSWRFFIWNSSCGSGVPGRSSSANFQCAFRSCCCNFVHGFSVGSNASRSAELRDSHRFSSCGCARICPSWDIQGRISRGSGDLDRCGPQWHATMSDAFSPVEARSKNPVLKVQDGVCTKGWRHGEITGLVLATAGFFVFHQLGGLTLHVCLQTPHVRSPVLVHGGDIFAEGRSEKLPQEIRIEWR